MCVIVEVCITVFKLNSLIYEHLGCFHILAIVDNAAINMEVYIIFQVSVSVFFRYIPRCGISGSYGSSNWNS